MDGGEPDGQGPGCCGGTAMSVHSTMTGGQALAAQLAAEGVDLIFGVPGVQLDHAIDGLARLDGRIAFRTVRHEQAASYMADGYARTSDRVGVCMVVPGPGLLNAAAGIATAYACSSRVLVLAGQLPSLAIGRGAGLLHEIPDQSRLLASLTKWSTLVRSPVDVPGAIRQAIHELRSGRPQPVGVEIPPDVLAAEAPVEIVDPPADDGDLLAPNDKQVAEVAGLLREAERPVLLVGGGVLAAGASEELRRVAEAAGAVVVMTRNGRGALSDRHPNAVGPLGVNPLLAEADTVLVVGSRFVLHSGHQPQVTPEATTVVVNADAADLARVKGARLLVLADARAFLSALAAELPPPGGQAGWAVAAAREVRVRAGDHLAALEPQMAFLGALRSAIPDHGVLVNELTQVGYVAGLAYPVWEPRTFITPGYQGTLGYGFPTALGVQAADPNRPVVSITGDGGFGWALQELATARRYNLGVTTVVFNNNAFANVQRTQIEEFDGRVFGSDLTNPDFLALAEAFGVPGVRAQRPSELAGALAEALTDPGPVLVEVPLGTVPSPWTLIQQGMPVAEPTGSSSGGAFP